MRFAFPRIAKVIAFAALNSTAAIAASPANIGASGAAPGALPLLEGCQIAGREVASHEAHGARRPVFPPVQLEVRTPFEPAAFRAGGYTYMLYELHLQNLADGPLALEGLEVRDADSASHPVIASLDRQRFSEALQPLGADTPEAGQPLEGGRAAVAFICLAYEHGARPGTALAHRVLLADGAAADGPTVKVSSRRVKILGPPVAGGGWIADNGPTRHSHHRAGLFVVDGRAQISRRFAIDWKVKENGEFSSGDPRDVRSYHAYGRPVFAVADATVVSVKDGLPDNIPRTPAGFETAVPITMETVGGNSVVLDLGEGQFAYYAHLKRGSLRIKVGDRVRRGDVLAAIGNSGDARWPHLHFQVADSPEILAGEGLPYVIDRFVTLGADGRAQVRLREFPLADAQIDFASR